MGGSGTGGGIYNYGNLTMTNCSVTLNVAERGNRTGGIGIGGSGGPGGSGGSGGSGTGNGTGIGDTGIEDLSDILRNVDLSYSHDGDDGDDGNAGGMGQSDDGEEIDGDEDGGGIYSHGNLTMTDCNVVDNDPNDIVVI